MEYYTATKRNELLVRAYIWMNLIGIKLSEKNQKKFMYDFIYMTFSSVQPLIHVRFFVTPWTVACQALLSTGFSSQEYWDGFPCPPPGNLPDPEFEPPSPEAPVLSGKFFADSLPLSHLGSLKNW